MTKQEFWKELSKIKGWKQTGYWSRFGFIRTRFPDEYDAYCPVTAVAKTYLGKSYNVSQWKWAANELGLDAKFAFRVASAADGNWFKMFTFLKLKRICK